MASRGWWRGAWIAVAALTVGSLALAASVDHAAPDGGAPPDCPDRLALSAGGDGESQILTFGPGTPFEAITPPDWYATKPRFSPDGESLVVVRAEGSYESAGPGSTELWRFGADGSGPRPLVDGPVQPHQDQPDWSPDGERIVFTSWAGGAAGTHLESVPAAGGPATVLTDPGVDRDLLPAWSPTSDRLAFVRQPDRDGPAHLWVAAADGSGARRVAELAAEAGSLAWTPDGGSVLVGGTGFGDDRRLRLVDVESGAVAVLDADGALVTFVPGTDRLHYLAPDGTGDNPFRPAEGRLVDGQVVLDRFTGPPTGFLYPYAGLDASACAAGTGT